MTIVLNENEWAQEMIASHSLGKKPYETLCRVARFYLDEGYKRGDVRKMLESFLIRCDQNASAALWMDSLDRAVASAVKRRAVAIDYIPVTEPEMARIREESGAQAQRLAFTLLCLAKYYLALNPDANGWVWLDDRDIMKMANIKTSVRRQSALYRQLRDDGLIQFSKKVDNTNVCVLFMESGEEAMRIDDMRSLGNQYMLRSGRPRYYICESCGEAAFSGQSAGKSAADRRGRSKKYCAECAEKLKHMTLSTGGSKR